MANTTLERAHQVFPYLSNLEDQVWKYLLHSTWSKPIPVVVAVSTTTTVTTSGSISSVTTTTTISVTTATITTITTATSVTTTTTSYTLCFMRMSYLPPKSGVVSLYFPKPSVKYSHTPPSACGLVWSMGILHLGFGKV